MKKTVALLLALIMCISLCACGGTSSDDSEKLNIDAYINGDGEAFIVNDKGEALQVPGDEKVASARMTADREHVVVLYENRDLSVFDSSMEQEVKIASDVSYVVAICDSGLLYRLDLYAGLTVDEVLKSIVADYGKDFDNEEEADETEDTEAADEAEDAEAADNEEDTAAADDAGTDKAEAETETESEDSAEKEDEITVESLKERLDEDADVEDAVDLYNDMVDNDYEEIYQLSQKCVRYLFDGAETVEISAAYGDNFSVTVANDNLNVLYTVGDTVYSMLETETEGTKLGTCKADYILPVAISSVTGQAVWGDVKAETTLVKKSTSKYGYNLNHNYDITYYTYSDNDTVKLFEANDLSSCDGGNVYFTNNGSSFIMCDSASAEDKLYTWDAENGCSSHNAGGEIISQLYTASGSLDRENEASVDGVYYLAKTDESFDIYYLSFTGDREKLVAGISDADYYVMDVLDGNLYYIDEEEVLYVAGVEGTELGEAEKIASDVYSYAIMNDGKTVAYLKDYDSNDGGSLFVKSSGNDAEKIASDIEYIYCTDNNNLLVMKDTQSVEGANGYYGELYLYNGGDELVKISSDVMVGSLAKYTTARGYDEDSLIFEKYDSVNDDGLIVSVIYFNGKEASGVLSDIVH